MELEAIKNRLREFIRSELMRKSDYPLGDDEPMITGGLIDSFSLVEISVFIDDELGVYIPDTDLTVANMDTLNQMAMRISRG